MGLLDLSGSYRTTGGLVPTYHEDPAAHESEDSSPRLPCNVKPADSCSLRPFLASVGSNCRHSVGVPHQVLDRQQIDARVP